MRLVIHTVDDPWAKLEPDSAAEAEALETAVSQGARAGGRAPEALEALRALAARRGYPVGEPERRAW